MIIYTGFQCTVNGVLDEKVVVSFNNVDGSIGLVFKGKDECVDTTLSYAAAIQLIGVLQLALDARLKNVPLEPPAEGRSASKRLLGGG